MKSDEELEDLVGEGLGIITLLKTIDSVLGLGSAGSTEELARVLQPNPSTRPFSNRNCLIIYIYS